jgi:hypothetical protein
VPIALRWLGGELPSTTLTRCSLWPSMMKGLAVGRDMSGPGLTYALHHGNGVERRDGQHLSGAI